MQNLSQSVSAMLAKTQPNVHHQQLQPLQISTSLPPTHPSQVLVGLFSQQLSQICADYTLRNVLAVFL